jgi:hypothetical protein
MIHVQFDEGSTEIEIPDRLEQDWLHPSTTDWYYLGVSACWFLLLIAVFQEVGIGIWILVFLAGWIQHKDGRGYFILGIMACNIWIDGVLKGVLWEVDPDRPRFAKLFRAPPPNDRLAINIVDELALIYNKKAKTDTIIIGGTGSDIAAHGIAAQRLINDRIAEAIKRIASVKNFEVMVTMMNIRRPSNVREVLEVYSTNLHPDFLPHDPESNPWLAVENLSEEEEAERTGDSNIATVMEELLTMARDETNKNTMAVAITIRRDDLLHKLAKKSQSMASSEDERYLIQEIAQVAIDSLMLCGVEDPHAYSLEEMHEHLRYVWDVKQDDVYASWQAENGGNRKDPKFKHFHWPQRFITTGKSSCNIDGSHHVVLRIDECPKTAEPDTFRPLFAIPVPNITVSLVGKTVRSNREVRVLDLATPSIDTFRDSLGVTHDTQKALDRSERMQARLETAYRSRYTQFYNIVLVVSGTDPRQLEREVEETIRSIHAIDGVRVKRVEGSFLQVPWVFAAHGAPV